MKATNLIKEVETMELGPMKSARLISVAVMMEAAMMEVAKREAVRMNKQQQQNQSGHFFHSNTLGFEKDEKIFIEIRENKTVNWYTTVV